MESTDLVPGRTRVSVHCDNGEVFTGVLQSLAWEERSDGGELVVLLDDQHRPGSAL
jgi:hypothetical protein